MSAFDSALARQRASLTQPSTSSPCSFLTTTPPPPPPPAITFTVFESQSFSRTSLKWRFPADDGADGVPTDSPASGFKKRPKSIPHFHDTTGKPSIPLDEVGGPGASYRSQGNWRLQLNCVADGVYGDGWEYSSDYGSLVTGVKRNGKERTKRWEGRWRDVYRRREWRRVYVRVAAEVGGGGGVIGGGGGGAAFTNKQATFTPPVVAAANDNSRRRTSTDDSMDVERRQIKQQLVLVNPTEMVNGLIQERDQAIRVINKDMVTLNQAFKDVAQLVDGQSGYIDELENTVAESHERTKEAVKDLEEAARYQRSSQCSVM